MYWFKHYTTLEEKPWLIVGDFNLLRKLEDRNKPGGDVNEMLIFNDAISSLGLIKLPLYGRKFNWTNEQPAPLLERLDSFFIKFLDYSLPRDLCQYSGNANF